MRTNVLAALALLGLTNITQAETGILVAHIPSAADRAVVMAVVRNALERRGWSVVATNSKSIAATIDGNKTDATIQLQINESSISYQGDATLTVATNGQTIKKPVAIPGRWLKALRIDIGDAFAAMPEKPPP
jgi:hypothetical protein